jgi:hypothetical protein
MTVRTTWLKPGANEIETQLTDDSQKHGSIALRKKLAITG